MTHQSQALDCIHVPRESRISIAEGFGNFLRILQAVPSRQVCEHSISAEGAVGTVFNQARKTFQSPSRNAGYSDRSNAPKRQFSSQTPDWRGNLLVPALKERAVGRVLRNGRQVVGQQLLLADLKARMRDVRVAPDGSIYVLTDGPDARLLRIVEP
ncbi:PQQ-dependent sugar dehydrogenase [Pseudomonas sp. 1121_17]|uniref:PQQ-dependent sugar dehydrogenase n=1 Tax=Pseudomonas sp. 1121_17 TaxID=2604458 RepID=UPI0040628FAC